MNQDEFGAMSTGFEGFYRSQDLPKSGVSTEYGRGSLRKDGEKGAADARIPTTAAMSAQVVQSRAYRRRTREEFEYMAPR